MQAKIIALLVVGLGLFICVLNLVYSMEDREVMEKGTETIATAINKSVEKSRKSTSYYLKLRFDLPDGSPRTARVKVVKRLYDKTEAEAQVPIKYVEAQPEPIVRIKGETKGAPVMYVLGGIVAGFGTILVRRQFFRRKAAVA